jgi:predicted oxidoreductase
VELIPAITFTFGGLRVDADARVLNRRGSPIPGLLAAGADIGGCGCVQTPAALRRRSCSDCRRRTPPAGLTSR